MLFQPRESDCQNAPPPASPSLWRQWPGAKRVWLFPLPPLPDLLPPYSSSPSSLWPSESSPSPCHRQCCPCHLEQPPFCLNESETSRELLLRRDIVWPCLMTLTPPAAMSAWKIKHLLKLCSFFPSTSSGVACYSPCGPAHLGMMPFSSSWLPCYLPQRSPFCDRNIPPSTWFQAFRAMESGFFPPRGRVRALSSPLTLSSNIKIRSQQPGRETAPKHQQPSTRKMQGIPKTELACYGTAWVMLMDNLSYGWWNPATWNF